MSNPLLPAGTDSADAGTGGDTGTGVGVLGDGDRSHAAAQAYLLIREQILSGERAGGDWLREGELAESIGVSRTPVREALRRLTAEGLVRHERNRGVQVASWSAADLDEIFSLRSVLEPWGCRLAAQSGRVDVAALAELADGMDEAAGEWVLRAVTDGGSALPPRGQEPDIDRITALNNAFHRAILDAAGNRRLTGIIGTIVQVPLVWRTFSHYSPVHLRRQLAHHHEIVAALAAGDGDWAESVMCSHVRSAWSSFDPDDDPGGPPAV